MEKEHTNSIFHTHVYLYQKVRQWERSNWNRNQKEKTKQKNKTEMEVENRLKRQLGFIKFYLYSKRYVLEFFYETFQEKHLKL